MSKNRTHQARIGAELTAREALDWKGINALLWERFNLDWPHMQTLLETQTRSTEAQRRALYRLMASKIPELRTSPIWRQLCRGYPELQPGDETLVVELTLIVPGAAVLINGIENPGTSSQLRARVEREHPAAAAWLHSHLEALGIRRK